MSGYKTRLERESSAWVDSGIITADQRAALLARSGEEGGPGRFVAALAAIGGALVLAGIFLLISANWREIGDWVKIVGLLVLLIGAHAAGWRLKISPGLYPRTGDAFFTLGAGLFLAGIALVSQIFHLNARPSSGVLVWWLGIAGIPWLVRSRGVQILSVLAGLLWFVLELKTPGSWLAIGGRTYADNWFWAMWMLAVPLGLALWLDGLRLRDTGFAEFSGLHEKIGILMLCSGLYALGFLMEHWSWRDQVAAVPMGPVILVLLVLLVSAWGAWRSIRRSSWFLRFCVVASVLLVVPVLAAWNPGNDGWLWSALAWVVLFILNVAMVSEGVASFRSAWVNLGLLFIALNIVTRYLQLFGAMLEGGLFFVATGIVVIGLGIWLEKKRRALLDSMRVGRGAA